MWTGSHFSVSSLILKLVIFFPTLNSILMVTFESSWDHWIQQSLQRAQYNAKLTVGVTEPTLGPFAHTQKGQSTERESWWRRVQHLLFRHQARRTGNSRSEDQSSPMAVRGRALRARRGGAAGGTTSSCRILRCTGIRVTFQASVTFWGFNQSRVYVLAVSGFHLVGLCFL